MRNRLGFLFCIALMLACGSARAAGDWSVYWGAGGGALLPKGSGNRIGLNAAGRFGIETSRLPGFALEGDLTTTLIKGHYSDRDLKLTSLAGYLAWRSSGRWYLKARVGGVWERVDVGGGNANDDGLSGGIGTGYRFADGRALELEFTVIEHNVNMLSLMYQF
jgi:hypothetical protein